MKNILIPLGIVLIASEVVLSSISRNSFYKQSVFIIAGLALIFMFRNFDWRSALGNRSFIFGLYAVVILFLVLVLFVGPPIRNVRSWLVLGPIGFQPAELAKLS